MPPAVAVFGNCFRKKHFSFDYIPPGFLSIYSSFNHTAGSKLHLAVFTVPPAFTVFCKSGIIKIYFSVPDHPPAFAVFRHRIVINYFSINHMPPGFLSVNCSLDNIIKAFGRQSVYIVIPFISPLLLIKTGSHYFSAKIYIQIDISGDSVNDSFRGTLPHIIISCICTSTAPLSHPFIPLIKTAVCQIICKPVQICINSSIISCSFNCIAECLCNICNFLLTQITLNIIFQIIIDRIGKIISFYQSQDMSGFTPGLCNSIRIRIQVCTKRNFILFARLRIYIPIDIILVFLILAISASYNSIVYTSCFCLDPVNFPLMFTDINAISFSPLNISRPGSILGKLRELRNTLSLLNAFSILIPPAVRIIRCFRIIFFLFIRYRRTLFCRFCNMYICSNDRKS